MPIGSGVGCVEHLHHLEVQRADLERLPEQLAGIVLHREEAEYLEELRQQGRILVAEDMRVVGVGRSALEALGHELLEPRLANPVELPAVVDRELGGIGEKGFAGGGRGPGGRVEREVRTAAAAARARHRRESVPDCGSPAHQRLEGVGIEVDVRDRAEERLDCEDPRLAIFESGRAGLRRVPADSLQEMEQGVHEDSGDGILAADAEPVAAFALVRLFALIAEHLRHLPFRTRDRAGMSRMSGG